jgi:hypothetical protein
VIDQRIIPDFTEPHEGYTNASLRRMVVDLRRENTQLREALADGSWRPIETAPKDGTEIIILGKWTKDCSRAYWDGGLWQTYSGGHEENPTHWMPLPPEAA